MVRGENNLKSFNLCEFDIITYLCVKITVKAVILYNNI